MPNKVVSKYFSNKTGMDDSLSDFQEKKKYNNGPKNVKTSRNKKKPKRAKGQKDIRTLIKKENDVLSYSKDFDKVCKEAGVDVDSEELQLAIALSKSLNDVKKENSSEIETKSTEQLTSRQRTLKIKTTLQEYGFRVPKTKMTEANRRNRSKKQYKLLLISETERQQIISDKYSEVLAGNIFKSPAKVSDSNCSDKELYYKTTNIAYEHIKNDDVYYVKDLFDKSGHNICLLRDWSEIPGRPVSPKVEVNNINFDKIICDQHELDCILSGTIIAAQQIVTDKNHDPAHNSILKSVQFKLDESRPLVNEVGHNTAIGIELSKGNISLKEVSCYTNSNTMSVSQARCISPDLFDDEVSVVIECPDTDVQISGQTFSKSDNIHTYCMDLTECVNIDSYNSDLSAKTKLWTNNENNIPNRSSNDLMEITECVSTSSTQINVEKVDLTQSSNEQTEDIISQNENNEVMDVTQVPDYNPLVEEISKIEKNNFLDDTIIVVDDDLNSEQQLHKHKLSPRERTEPIWIDALNNGKSDFSSENAKDESYQRLSNRIKGHLFDKSYNSNCDYKKHTFKSIEKVADHKNKLVECPLDTLDLTQSSNSSEGEILTKQHISNYSPSLGKRDNISIDYDEIDIVSVTSLKSDNSSEGEILTKQHISNYSPSLGKRDNISIDYDEIDIVSVTSLKSDKGYKYENNSVENEASESNNDVASNPNKSSGPFTFFDKEPNYSLLHSKHDTSVEHGNYEISDDIDSVPVTSLRSNECHKYEINSIEKEANVSNKNIALNPSNSLEVFETFEEESNNSELKSKRDVNVSPVKEAFNSNNGTALSPNKSSEVFEISDKEFNYSIHQSVYENFDFRDVSVMNDFSNKNHSVGEWHYPTTKNRLLSESNLQRDNIISPQKEVSRSQKLHFNSETSNVIRMPQENIKNILNTPKNGEYIIKTNDVTPMLDYASMSSPERHKELEKYGLKPFKRKRAIQLLTYMYNQTHPIVELHDHSCPSPSKRQKRDNGDEKIISPKMTSKCESLASLTSKAPVKPIESISDVNKENNLYAVTTEQPDIRNIECGSENWFFQKREKAKLYSCRVPLHVAFHNYVSCRRRLREAILRYEPVNIDVIHKELVASGYRYNPKDLLKFMDRKCITVKTAENNSRNRKS